MLDPLSALEKFFGFKEFRDGQEEIIQTILDGENVLVIMPTGGGKSLCFQLPALIKSGMTLVVSPLIALMKDQVDALRQRGIAADFINSSLSAAAQRDRLEAMREGKLKLVYVAPERFRNSSFVEAVRDLPVSLFAIDEAHCISQWGHDFRPDYYRMGSVLESFGKPQVAAFTATATPAVRTDILRALHLPGARTFVAGFGRPNLSLGVSLVHNDADKFERLKTLIKAQKTGIVYCATRKKVEAVAEAATRWKIPFVSYHGGMDESSRTRAQDCFLGKEADVAIATNAFGMGIDRADLRFVAHFEVPGSIEAYYQEVGRAGRDGLPSVCELLFLYPDVRVQEFFLEGSNPAPDLISSLWRVLRQRVDEKGELRKSAADLAALMPGCRNDMSVSSAMVILQKAGYLERFDISGQLLRGTRLLRPEVTPQNLDIDWEALAEKERIDRERLRLMVEFSYTKDCRQQFILKAFGEHVSERCGACDRCRTRRKKGQRPPQDEEIVRVQKLLSCIARMSRKHGDQWEGRFGRQRIVQVLVGSKAATVTSAGLDRLSTYGLLQKEGETYVSALLGEAIEAGLAEVQAGQYPVVTLGPNGEAAMRGGVDYQLAWPDSDRSRKEPPSEKPKKKTKPETPDVPIPLGDLTLFELLREKRSCMAKEREVPSYVIASDAVLRELAARRPLTPEAALSIRGIGERKAKEILPPFLEAIREYTKNLESGA